MRRTVRIAVAAVFGLTAWAGPGAALASGPFGPHQDIFGLVNGEHSGAVIYTVCPGPIDGDATGPPAGGQTVAALHVSAGGGIPGKVVSSSTPASRPRPS